MRTTNSISQEKARAKRQAKRKSSQLQSNLEHGQEELKNLASTLDRRLHSNPWPVVTGVAVGCLLFGYIMGSKR